MKRLALASALVTLGALSLGGCGDGGGGAVVDAGKNTDAGKAIDAGKVDTVTVRGMAEDLVGSCEKDSDCANPDSDCVQTSYFQGTSCQPKCTTTAECPLDTYCYKSTSANNIAMKNHCGFSLCGEDLDPTNHTVGETGGPCQLGQETGLAQSERLPGLCFPLNDHHFGQCVETGSQTEGKSCDATRARDGELCDQMTFCDAGQTAVKGKCKRLCDPETILSRAAGDNSGCATGQDCRDASNGRVLMDAMGKPVVQRTSIGFCDNGVACITVGTNTCPDDANGVAQGCAASNILRATGWCDIGATGLLTLGAACSTDATADAMECPHASWCVGDATMAKCTALCDIAPLGHAAGADGGLGAAQPLVTCTTGTACKPFLFAGKDKMPFTEDDFSTFDWGLCQ